MLIDTKKSVPLGIRLFKRNLKAMYRQSLFGILWAFVPPIMLALVWVFLNGQKIINVDQPVVPYPAFVMTSILLWSVFAQAIVMPTNVMSEGKSILVKINFPRESLLISGLCQICFDFLIKAVLIAVILVFFQVFPKITLFLVPVGILMLALLGVAIGLLFLPISLLYSDIQRFLVAILPFWMLLTPVVYPEPRTGLGQQINVFNPVSTLLSTTRDWLFVGEVDNLSVFLITSVIIIISTIIGLLLFRLAIPFIIERSGS